MTIVIIPKTDLFAATTLNVTTALADDLVSSGFGKLDVDDLFKGRNLQNRFQVYARDESEWLSEPDDGRSRKGSDFQESMRSLLPRQLRWALIRNRLRAW
jgi:hypothetical protein